MVRRHRQHSKGVFTRVAISWSMAMLAGCVIVMINPLGRVTLEQVILRSSCVLGMLMSRELFRIEMSEGKPICYNLAVLFACTGVLIFLTETDSVMIVTDAPFAGFYLNQYGNAIYNMLLLFCASFLVAQTLLTRSSPLGKYFIAGMLSVGSSVVLYYPVIDNPRYAYAVPDVLDFVLIENAQKELRKKSISGPEAESIARQISLPRWNGFSRIGELSYGESLERVKEILPYTKGSNYANLIHAPLRLIGLRMNLLAGCMLLFLILVNLVKDPPQGAYRDKLNLAFFAYMVFEIAHGFVFRDIIEWDVFLRIDAIGKIVTALLVLMLVSIEFRRYRFLAEGVGIYYETLLVTNPRGVTRWRDGLDRLVLREFFRTDSLDRRFLQKSEKGESGNRNNSVLFRKNT